MWVIIFKLWMREKAVDRTTEVSGAGIEFIPFSPQPVLLLTGVITADTTNRDTPPPPPPFLGFRLVKETTILTRIPEHWLVNDMRFRPAACQVVLCGQRHKLQITVCV